MAPNPKSGSLKWINFGNYCWKNYSMKFGFGLYKLYTVHHVFPTHSTYNIDFCLHQTLKNIKDMKRGQVFEVPKQG